MLEAQPAPPRQGGRVQLRSGAILTGLYLLMALLAPLLAPYNYAEVLDGAAAKKRPPGTRLHAIALSDGKWRLADRVERTPEGLVIERLGETAIIPDARVINLTANGVADSRLYLLGSDRHGRDLLSRLLVGAWISLKIALLAVMLSLTLGIAVGALAATSRGLVDGLLMRVVDALMALPSLFLLLALAGLFRPSTTMIGLILGTLGWMPTSRLVRAEILGLQGREFVVAARSLGSGPWRIFFRHLLPNALTPVLVQAPLLLGAIIMIEASLSFIGFGVELPTPSWGTMIADGWVGRRGAWWSYTFPGTALALTVISVNLLADGLRDALDPRRKGARL